MVRFSRTKTLQGFKASKKLFEGNKEGGEKNQEVP